MKCLELDARHHECHGLARALVGSQCALSRPAVRAGRIGFELVQPLQDVFLMCRGDENPKWESVTPHHVIFLPLDTLKLCPFVAFREGVRVKGKPNRNPTRIHHGIIGEIFTADNGWIYPSICNKETMIAAEDGGHFDVKLDLSHLPKGARIVEVEE